MNRDRHRAILFARSTHGPAAVKEQVRAMQQYADDNGIRVIGRVTIPHCSADDYRCQRHLTVLLGRSGSRASMVILADLSRLSRRGMPQATSLIRRLAEAGVAVVTPNLGKINERFSPWLAPRNNRVPNPAQPAR